MSFKNNAKFWQQEIQNTNKLFLDVKNKPTTLLQRIQLINKQNQCPQRIDRRAEGRHSTLDDEIQRIEKEVARLEVDLKKNQDSYARAVKSMLKTNRTNNTLFLWLSGNQSESRSVECNISVIIRDGVRNRPKK